MAELQRANDELKLIDADQIAQEILYDKQRTFDYHNKAGKQLVRLLSENP